MEYDLEERFINFAVDVIEISKTLRPSIASTHLNKQLVRSATSIPLNYAESRSAESINDFIHKLSISLKELRETRVNLEILKRSNLIKDEDRLNKGLLEINQLIAILTKSISTTKKRHVSSS